MSTYAKELARIAFHLKQPGALQNHAGKADPPEHETAFAVCEIVESARKICDILYPRLSAAARPDVHADTLMEFREEVRHILYHIEDCEYFSGLR